MLASFSKEDCCIVGREAVYSGTESAEYPAAVVIRFLYPDRGTRVHYLTDATWVGGGEQMPLQYFFYQRIVSFGH